MTSLTLHLKSRRVVDRSQKPSTDRGAISDFTARLNLSGLVPDRLLSMSVAEIESLAIATETGMSTISDEFTVHDGTRDQLVLCGDLSHCDHVAGEMRSGELIIEGSVGNYLASNMRGGRVVVTGNAGDYACSSLRAGQVTVEGDVRCHAAAAVPFASRGMSGGDFLIRGSADQFLATRMRRGRVIVLGDVAAGCATRLIAGTVFVCGRVTLPLGCGMARGTLLLSNPTQQLMTTVPVGFTTLEPCELSFLPLLLRDIAPHLPAEAAADITSSRWLRGMGDRAEAGLGELFVRELALG